MAFSIEKMQSSASEDAPIWINYGLDGIGKTTFAAEFAGPDLSEAVYLPTKGERPPRALAGLKTPGTVGSFLDVYDIVKELQTSRHDFKWLIMDALDGFEPLVWNETCARMNWPNIEQPGFGKGYLAAETEWGEFLGWMTDLQKDGMGVMLLAHPKIVRFDSPITEPYNRYTLKLQDRANALVREHADIVSFMNYRVSIREKEVARNKTVSHAEGGKVREVCFSTSASYDAKNRYDMPDAVIYKKSQAEKDIGQYFPLPRGVN